MIDIPRDVVRRFRTVLRQSLLAQEARSPWPLLLIRSDKAGLLLQATHGDLALRYCHPEPGGSGVIALRSNLLAEFEGRQSDKVTLALAAPGKGTACWKEAGSLRTIEFDTVVPESVPQFPALPKQFIPFTGGLQALAEAGQTTARSNVRFALACIQLRGKTGEVIGTDGRQLLIHGGLAFPWQDDVLVPRVPAFGLQEVATAQPVEIGRTESRVAVRAGCWTFVLRCDTSSRYPNVNAVIPRPSPKATHLCIDPSDASYLLATLPKLPGRNDDHCPITLDLGSQVALRARDTEQARITEVTLARSRAVGPPVRLCMDRHFLLRAVKLGLSQLHVTAADKPVLCKDQVRTYVWMPLEKHAAMPAAKNMICLTSSSGEVETSTTPRERTKHPMPASNQNGHGSGKDHSPPVQSERHGIEEIITEAEALRAQLQEAGVRIVRLLSALKNQRRQSRAVQAAMTSLQRLQLPR